MKLSDLKEQETIVKIINKDSDWYGLYGIVDFIDDDCAYIFCVSKPTYHYKVTIDNINDIEIVNFNTYKTKSKEIKIIDLPHYQIDNINQLEVGNMVGIVANNEWNNNIGLISFINDDVAYIRCCNKQCSCEVRNNNLNDIILLKDR